MSYRHVRAVKFMSPYTHLLPVDHEKILTTLKKTMVDELLEDYPSTEYRSITFEVLKPSPSELGELAESFKRLGGRYHYGGDFVSREWLEKELSQKDYKIFMNAYVKEADDENR